MTQKSNDSPWPMVMVPKKEWKALVRWFKTTEKVMRDSFGTPGHMADWKEYYQENDREEFKIYDAARRAASRKFNR